MHKRWDSFSWFSIDAYDVAGTRVPYDKTAKKKTKIDGATIARTLELVAILIAHPPLNRSEGGFKGAEKVFQGRLKQRSHSTRDLLEQMRVLLDSVAKPTS